VAKTRRESRERALQVLFLMEARALGAEDAIDVFSRSLYAEDVWSPKMPRDVMMENLVHHYAAHAADIDQHITSSSDNWRLDRMPRVERNLLRMATGEMMLGETPAPIIIDEALELTRQFAGDAAVGFVNGVLDNVRRRLASLANTKA
jgi:transcription antitermination protein NusB